MKKLKLVSPIPVSVNHYIKPRVFMSGKKPMVSMYETAEAKKYKKDFAKYINEEIEKQQWNIIPNKTQHFYIDCVFYFDRIDKDPNNYFKLLLDAITETQKIWVDDNVTCERVNGIFYDSKNPHIDITIYPVDYVGIFQSVEQLQSFESNCITCSRYKNNCSLLIKAKKGRIQEEIQDGVCSKFK
ncbi:RusA family crossover junction endodeoxyribonuclease [Anaerovorax sp. IOR16]|uniref:RusA family crossover junction endodeoxyribonuclease n=1 Tax=Anaerovorax sp. IOR16 TaxID=2773458 RepID=UPI0019D1A1BF|nr:RusA family crossover junction endodeoxyribonuclease [Anaerovorax sp. IOR16]